MELLHQYKSYRCLSANGFHLHSVPSSSEGRYICPGGDNSQICQRKYRPATRSTSTLALVSILYYICICLHFLPYFVFFGCFVCNFSPFESWSGHFFNLPLGQTANIQETHPACFGWKIYNAYKKKFNTLTMSNCIGPDEIYAFQMCTLNTWICLQFLDK